MITNIFLLKTFTCDEHCIWTPGTDKDVISIVIDLRKNMVLPRLHIRRNIINLGVFLIISFFTDIYRLFELINKYIYLYLWKIKMSKKVVASTKPMHSVAKKAQGINGTLSRMISGKGGYFSMSGTRSWTTVSINDVHKQVNNK